MSEEQDHSGHEKMSTGHKGPGLAIGGQAIGAVQRTFIIAEAGVNHDGAIHKALQLVDAAAAVGADAVKFQVFRAQELVTADARTAAYQREGTGDSVQQAMLSRLELDDGALQRLKEHAHSKGLAFLATPFSERDVARLAALNPAAIKIASTDLTNTTLLRAAIMTDKPLIVSTGAATAREIAGTLSWMSGQCVMDRLILLHCISAYPTPLEAANLGAIRELANLSGVPVGFSDHTLSTHIGAWAVCAGACVLEKHLTLNRHAAGPDHAMSLDPMLFAEYVREVRVAESALGSGTLGMQEIEAEVRMVARRSVVAVRNIARGSVITADMLTLKRPGGGIAPERLGELLGKTACADIPSDTILSWNLLR